MSSYEFDVMIIGSGIAGTFSCHYLGGKRFTVGVVTREEDPKVSNTYWAQGGIITSMKKMMILLMIFKRHQLGLLMS